jgi:hypothetical protein
MQVIELHFTAGCNMKTGAQTDSLRQRIAVAEATPDTTLVNLYFETGKEYEKTDMDSAAFFYRKAGDLSDRMKWTAGQFRFTEEYGGILQLKGMPDSALRHPFPVFRIATP